MSRSILSGSFLLLALTSSGCELLADFEKDGPSTGGKRVTVAESGKAGRESTAAGGSGGTSSEVGGTSSTTSTGAAGGSTIAGSGGAAAGTTQFTAGGVTANGGVSGTAPIVGGAIGSGGTSTGVGGASTGGAGPVGGTSNSTGGALVSTGGGSAGAGGSSAGGGTVALSPSITSFGVDYGTVCSGHRAKLRAEFSNGTGTIDGGVGIVANGVATETGAITENTTFKLTVTNANEQKVEATVEVIALKSGSVTRTGEMLNLTYNHSATLLPNGKVLITGGGTPCANQAELYDPKTGEFTSTGAMVACRLGSRAVLLNSGKVLVVGGFDFVDNDYVALSTADLYDPSAGKFVSAGSLPGYGGEVAITRLSTTGQVLVTGTTASLFVPATGLLGEFLSAPPMQSARMHHTATLLQNGSVLLVGGFGPGAGGAFQTWSSGEIYNGIGFSATGSMAVVRNRHTATLLTNGNVLVTGGWDLSKPTATAELYSSATREFVATAGNMIIPRYDHSATLLGSGKVLVTGGFSAFDSDGLPTMELYDPLTMTFSYVQNMFSGRVMHQATELPNGAILITGGLVRRNTIATVAELYCP